MTRESYLLAQLQWPSGTRRQSFGFLLQLLARHVDQDMKARIEDLGIIPKHFETLMVLLASSGISQREMGQKLFLPEYQISRNLDAMEADGLVERRPSPTSRRTTELFLTEKGREVAMQLPPLINNLNSEFLQVLDDSEKATLVELLQRVLTGFESRS